MDQFKYTFCGLKPHLSGQNDNNRLKIVKIVGKTSYFWTFRYESVGKKLGYGDGSHNVTDLW